MLQTRFKCGEWLSSKKFLEVLIKKTINLDFKNISLEAVPFAVEGTTLYTREFFGIFLVKNLSLCF
jgi:hypothetical protein